MRRAKCVSALLFAVFAAALAVFSILPVTAKETGKYSLEIITAETDDYSHKKTAADGASFEIRLAARSDGKSGYAAEKSYSIYSDELTRFSSLTADESEHLAADMIKITDNAVQTGKSDADGKIIFSGLDPGIYLVIQTGRTGTAENYEETEPFLIAVPGADGKSVVTCEPKLTKITRSETPENEDNIAGTKNPAKGDESSAENREKTEKDSEKNTVSAVMTGDDTMLSVWAFPAAFIAFEAVIWRLDSSRRRKQKESQKGNI